jgi:molybdenum cofactor guanylyltransferase
MILGAVLAGGSARRFGSDKALALVDGCVLIDHVVDRLVLQSDALVIVGRDHGDWPALADRPLGGQGPLAGLNAALHYAAAHGYTAVLSVPCDMPDLPSDLAAMLASGPAVLADHPVVGLWPVSLAPILDTWLTSGERSVRGFAGHIGARQIAAQSLRNINSPADL